MKIILAAGGSGGHIFPSVALAGELGKRGIKEIFFISSKRRLDKSILAESKYPCFFLSVNPMPLKFRPIRIITFLFKLFSDAIMSIYIIFRVKPDVVVGFGGYSSGAIVLTAKMFNIPVVIHEQNCVPGKANKMLGRIADRIAVSFTGAEEHFPCVREKLVHTGNPLRIDMLTNNREVSAKRLGLDPERITILVMGGSQGATFLNTIASEAALLVNEKYANTVQFVHITGNNDYENIKSFYREKKIKNKTISFMERIDDAYAVSDIVISRSGAAAVFELAFYARAMILVPYPNPKNNQRSNAIYFSDKGAAIYREERDISKDVLFDEVLGLLEDKIKRDEIAGCAERLAMPEAGRLLAEEVIKLGQHGRTPFRTDV
ncbi:MAG: undecaprenyldiphospho-muramoylpentapeptide beta-N-acetylglucosaminyltransferase [Candidatus Omnitrophica bacterium]|nr:undecaprenyldiphospho-muramoylpentapeptide beta-N-acetylglucosaminyltransferase [Candidatus Omnitrophota bacterium]